MPKRGRYKKALTASNADTTGHKKRKNTYQIHFPSNQRERKRREIISFSLVFFAPITLPCNLRITIDGVKLMDGIRQKKKKKEKEKQKKGNRNRCFFSLSPYLGISLCALLSFFVPPPPRYTSPPDPCE